MLSSSATCSTLSSRRSRSQPASISRANSSPAGPTRACSASSTPNCTSGISIAMFRAAPGIFPARSLLLCRVSPRAQTHPVQMNAMEPAEAEGKFRRGLEQFNQGHFFDAHETWEEIWLASLEPERTFLQGIIPAAAAFHHYSRGNRRGTQSLLEAGLKKLEPFPKAHHGIALEPLRAAARRWIAALAAEKDPPENQLTKIQRVQR